MGDLIDHHVHGVVRSPLDGHGIELLLNEGGQPAPAGTSHFDSPVGLAVLAHCGPLLGVPPGGGREAYLAAREPLGVEEVNRRLIGAAGLGGLLIDTGHRADEILDCAEMGLLAGAPAHEVVRVETAAERLAAASDGPAAWCRDLGDGLLAAATGAVGLKTVVAYRHGLDLDAALPAADEIGRAAEAWFASSHTGFRLTSPVLLAAVLHAAAAVARERRLPLQVHTGFGDPDLTLHRADPSRFTPWLRLFDSMAVDCVLLHCYPYHRQAGYLAAVFPHVYFDVGCAINYTGASARTVLAEALEMAPFTKQLYSSDAFGLPELVYLGAVLFRSSLAEILDGWVGAGSCTRDQAARITTMIGSGNARRLYRLDDIEQDKPDRRQ